MPVEPDRSAASRDSVLTLRRVERQARIVELLLGSPERMTLEALAWRLGASARTVARDLERLRESGVPIDVVPGRNGGARLSGTLDPAPVALGVSELAALIASLSALGPTATESSRTAMLRLVDALTGASPTERGAAPGAGASRSPRLPV